MSVYDPKAKYNVKQQTCNSIQNSYKQIAEYYDLNMPRETKQNIQRLCHEV